MCFRQIIPLHMKYRLYASPVRMMMFYDSESLLKAIKDDGVADWNMLKGR